MHVDSLEARRLFAGGALDTTFGTAGTATAAFTVGKTAGDRVSPESVAADSLGRVYAVGETDKTTQITRLNSDGSVDSAFGTNGLMYFNRPVTDIFKIKVDAANRLLVLTGNVIARYTDVGRIDASFASKGKLAVADMSKINSFDVDANNRVYVVGTVAAGKTTTRARVERFVSKGRIDSSFLSGGLTLPLPSSLSSSASATGNAVRAFGNGTVLVTGDLTQGSASGVEAMHILVNGTIDTTYGKNSVAGILSKPSIEDSDFAEEYSIRSSGINADGTVNVLGTEDQAGEPGTFNAYSNQFSTAGVIGSVDNLPDLSFAAASGAFELNNGGIIHALADGTTDTSFNGTGAITNVSTFTLAPDGTLVALVFNSGSTTSFSVKRYFSDDLPVAVALAKPLKAAATSVRFSVVYRDANGIDASSITGREIRLVAPDGTYRRPHLLSVTTLANGSVLATYKSTDPGSQPWDSADDGLYTIRTIANIVKDQNGMFLPKRNIGTLQVTIA